MTARSYGNPARYASGETPESGDRVRGRWSHRTATVESVEYDGDATRMKVTYDDTTIPPSLGASPRMYELVSREQLVAAPDFKVGDRVYVSAFNKHGTVTDVIRAAKWERAIGAYKYRVLHDSERQESVSYTYWQPALTLVGREGAVEDDFSVGDTVSVEGRRGFAKVIGLGERTSNGQRYRLQWDGVGATEYVPSSVMTRIREGETMLKRGDIGKRLDSAEERLDKVEGTAHTAFENELQTASKVVRLSERIDGVDVVVQSTADRVRKIESREGSGSAGLNALSSTVANVDREINKLNDKVEHVASTESKRVELALARIQECRGDLALLAKAQLKASGFIAVDGVDPIEALQAAYGVSTESKEPQWTWTPKGSLRSSGASHQSGVASSDVIAGLVDLNKRVSAVDAHFNELDSALYDVDGESLITDLDERVGAIEAKINHPSAGRAVDGVVYSPLYASDRERIAELDKRVSNQTRLIADLVRELTETRTAAAEILEKHPAVGKRIEALERRFNYAQHRARKLRAGPLSYDKRLAELEIETALLATAVGPPALGLNNAAERIERLEAAERNRDKYLRYMKERGKDYKSRLDRLEAASGEAMSDRVNALALHIGEIQAALSDRSGKPTKFQAWDSLRANVVDHERAIESRWEAFVTSQRNLSARVEDVAEKTSLRLETFRKAQLDEIERKIGPWRRATEAISGRITGHDEALNELRSSIATKRSENTSALDRVLDEIQTLWTALRGLQSEVNELQGSAVGDSVRSLGSLLVEALQSPAGRKLTDEQRHGAENEDDGGPLDFDGEPYPGWRPCGVPDCGICKINREYREKLDEASSGIPVVIAFNDGREVSATATSYTESVQDDGSVFVDIVICEPRVVNPAWECLHKGERNESEHGTYGKDEDGV